jgi:hypothetical protein
VSPVQEAEAVLQDFQGAGAGDVDTFLGHGLEDGEHHVLFEHGRGVFDLQRLGEGDKIGRGLFLQLLQRHARHAHGRDGVAGGGGFLGAVRRVGVG